MLWFCWAVGQLINIISLFITAVDAGKSQVNIRFGVRGEGGGFFFSCVHLLPHGIKDELVPEVLDEDAVLILGSLPL